MADPDNFAAAFLALVRTLDEEPERRKHLEAFAAFVAELAKKVAKEAEHEIAGIDDDALAALRERVAGLIEDGRRRAFEAREKDIREAIEIGGRFNSVMLLEVAAGILHGQSEPSPALAEWFTQATKAIASGTPADDAFGTRRKRGPHDPVASRDERIARERRICDAVDQARADGYPTSPSRERASCFEVAAERLGLAGESVARKVYYQWERVEFAVGEAEVPPNTP